MTEERLEALFNTFDVDKTGQITAENIKKAFTKFNKEVSDEELAEIMKQHDHDGCDGLSRDEFKAMMLDET